MPLALPDPSDDIESPLRLTHTGLSAAPACWYDGSFSIPLKSQPELTSTRHIGSGDFGGQRGSRTHSCWVQTSRIPVLLVARIVEGVLPLH